MLWETETVKPMTLTHTQIRTKQITGEVCFIGRDGDRCRVRLENGWKGFKLQGDVWVAVTPKVKAGGFIS